MAPFTPLHGFWLGRTNYLWGSALAWIALGWTVHLGWVVGALSVSWSVHVAASLVPFLIGQIRRQSWGRVLCTSLGIFGGLVPWTPQLFEPRAPTLERDESSLRFMVANTFYTPPRLQALTSDIESAHADVLGLVEPPTALPSHLVATGRWALLAAYLPGGKHNIALLVRAELLAPQGPLTVSSSEPLLTDYTPSVALEARLGWRGRDFMVVVAHPPAPTDSAQNAQRLRLVPELARRLGRPAVLLADLNATRASPLWHGLTRSGLRRPAGGTPGTWPSWLGARGLAIDHILVTEGFKASPARAVGLTGSDHRGLVLDLAPRR